MVAMPVATTILLTTCEEYSVTYKTAPVLSETMPTGTERLALDP